MNTSGAEQAGEDERLRAVLAAAGVDWDRVTSCQGLAGGTFSTVYLVRRADAGGLVVKLAPDPGESLLRYEHRILTTEAMYYRAAARHPDVTVPSVIDVNAGNAVAPGGYLVMTECPGRPWHTLSPKLDDQERDALRAELGRQVAVLHTITGSEFGYPACSVGPLRPTWRAAFLDMIDAVLTDAVQHAVALPRPAAEVRDLFQAQAPVLDQVRTPVLVHFDLWDGNILVDRDGDAPRIGGLIDAERSFWGDPLAEFVSLALFGDIEQDTAFLRGYRAAGGTAIFDDAARLRLSMYRAYLYLIMWVEAVPRKYVDAARVAWLREWVLKPLTAILGDWALAAAGR
jgi:aminoglycoside phosphotransferase (APT) family kinase protein